MTDEEKAEEYVNKRPFIHLLGRNTFFIQKEFRDAILWALAEGRKEKWHDLRKCPDDLPKCAENKQIIFYVREFNTDIAKDTSHFCLGFYTKAFMNDDIKVFVEKSKGYECEHLSQEVIKWCELPQFKE